MNWKNMKNNIVDVLCSPVLYSTLLILLIIILASL